MPNAEERAKYHQKVVEQGRKDNAKYYTRHREEIKEKARQRYYTKRGLVPPARKTNDTPPVAVKDPEPIAGAGIVDDDKKERLKRFLFTMSVLEMFDLTKQSRVLDTIFI